MSDAPIAEQLRELAQLADERGLHKAADFCRYQANQVFTQDQSYFEQNAHPTQK